MAQDTEPNEFHLTYLAIGYCVTKWEHLETRLFELYSNLCSGDHFTDIQSYSALNSFRSRIDVIRRLAEFRLEDNPDFLKRVISMIDRISRLSKRRNEVVHGQLSESTGSFYHDDGSSKIVRSLTVRNSIYGSQWNISISKKAYSHNADKIIEFANNFEKCRHDLND